MPTAIIATIACHMEREREQGGRGKGGRTQGGNQSKKKKEKNKCQNIDHATQIKRAGSHVNGRFWTEHIKQNVINHAESFSWDDGQLNGTTEGKINSFSYLMNRWSNWRRPGRCRPGWSRCIGRYQSRRPPDLKSSNYFR